jgi:prevent-host-death family protein
MKEITLREANQQFSRIVREVEESGEAVRVLRNGKPAVDILPARMGEMRRKLTEDQRAAIDEFIRLAREEPGNSDGRPHLTRDQLHER